MVKITDKRVKEYLQKVKKAFAAKVLLFGSRAKGSSLKESDYDLCVISEKFRGQDIRQRMESLYLMMIKNPFNADILALTPEEFEQLSGTFTIYGEIKKSGGPS